MRWDFLLEHWAARLLADPTLRSLMNADSGWIYPAQSVRPVKIPSIEYDAPITDVDTELFNEVTVQVDIWIRGSPLAKQAMRRVRTLTHNDVGQILGGERVWISYRDSRRLDYPKEPGVTHYTMDFEFEAVRGKYVGQ